ncbi:MAG: HAMP domain-containing histidine kinase [Rhodobacteraceae bacterium]|nr:HAMP domain-containing histidine kinase [Paracoccaceae bacterium]
MVLRAILAAFLLGATLVAPAAPCGAEAPGMLVLDPARPVPDLAAFMRFAPDEGLPISALIDAFTAGRLSADFLAVADATPPYRGVWGLVEIASGAPPDDRAPDAWILVSRIHGLIALDAFVIRLGGATEQVLANDMREPFDATEFSATLLRSAPVTLAAGERALLMVRMVHGAVDSAALSLETPAGLQAEAFRLGMELAGFYAFLVACLIVFAAFSASMRSGVGLLYAALLALLLLFLAYLDNLLFRLVYPAHPGWHLPVGLSLLLIVLAAGFAAAAMSERRFSARGRFARLLTGAAVASILALGLVPVVAADVLAPTIYLAMAGMVAAQVAVVFRWDVVGDVQRPAFRLVVLVALAGIVVAVALALARVDAGVVSINGLAKLVYLSVAVLIMGGLSVSLIDLRRAHASAQMDRIAALEAEAAASRDLLEAERNYSRARDLAARRRAQLADMSHDLRQPLASLRLTMTTALRDASAEDRARLAEAFDYLQGLTRAHQAEGDADEEEAPETAPEVYALALLLATIGQMFDAEAAAKGIDLRIVPSSVLVAARPLAVMRILSNLVANAIRHAGRGRILVGVRHRGGMAEVQVLDQGPGMDAEALDRFRLRGQSGDQSDGQGLGLAICFALAGDMGLDLQVASVPGRGTVFSLRIPRAA